MDKILLACNSEDEGRALEKVITGFSDYQVITATEGTTALTKAYTEHPTVIVLDVVLAGINGFEICRELKENPLTKDLPVVLMYTWADVSDRIHAYNVGADILLTKPLVAKEVEAVLAKSVRRKVYISAKEHVKALGDFMAELIIHGKACTIIPTYVLGREKDYCLKLAKHYNLSDVEARRLQIAINVQDWYEFLQQKAPGQEVVDSFKKLQLAQWLVPILDSKNKSVQEYALTSTEKIFSTVVAYGRIYLETHNNAHDSLIILHRRALAGKYDLDVVATIESIVRAESILAKLEGK